MALTTATHFLKINLLTTTSMRYVFHMLPLYPKQSILLFCKISLLKSTLIKRSLVVREDSDCLSSFRENDQNLMARLRSEVLINQLALWWKSIISMLAAVEKVAKGRFEALYIMKALLTYRVFCSKN